MEKVESERGANKRQHEANNEENEPPSKKQKVTETIETLKEMYGITYTNFQYKLWAEMYTYGSHPHLDEPPSAAMFNRDTKRSHGHGQTDVIMSVMDKLCTALTPEANNTQPYSSPVRKADLRSTYMKQLNELKMLHDTKILTDEEYMEQRDELVELMRQLKT